MQHFFSFYTIKDRHALETYYLITAQNKNYTIHKQHFLVQPVANINLTLHSAARTFLFCTHLDTTLSFTLLSINSTKLGLLNPLTALNKV